MKIKICGVTSPEEAVQAAQLGATHIGLNFYPPSPRCLEPEQAREISRAVRALRDPPVLVGVFVNEASEALQAAMAEFDLDLAQLSGDEPLEVLAAMQGRAFKAYRLSKSANQQISNLQPPVSTRQSRALLRTRRSAVPDLLLDAHVPGEYGGTGKTIDWARAAQLAQQVRLMLAGGLTPDNVAAAVRRVQPWGVDVASGVEREPGVKDVELMRNFIQNARGIVFRDT